MASLCTRCALRLQRAANAATTTQHSRPLSTNPQAFIRGLPSFQPTSNPELDALLTDFRYKHFLPAALEKPQWDLVFRNKNRNLLKENPQSVSIGTEVFELQYLGGYGVMPNRKEQLARVLDLMRKGEADDWNNLPNLLRGLHAMGKDPPPRVRARMIRQASVKGRFDVVMKCLRAAQATGLTLKDADTLHATIWGLRSIADQGDWSEDALAQALKYSNDVASLLESEVHGGGRNVAATDARRSPFVLGVFLELHAVYAYRFQGREDIDGRVKAFAERLLFNIPEVEMGLDVKLPTAGPVTPMREYGPLLHGLKLSSRVLGDALPEKAKAEAIIANYGTALHGLKEQVILLGKRDEEQAAAESKNYGEEALRVWQSIVADD